MTDQFELTSTFCIKPQQFAWFIGAGTSAVAGLPTAWDIMWDLKRRYYCREESQDISRQDVQIEAVRARIQSYMIAQGFPEERGPGEYTTYFQKNIWRRQRAATTVPQPHRDDLLCGKALGARRRLIFAGSQIGLSPKTGHCMRRRPGIG